MIAVPMSPAATQLKSVPRQASQSGRRVESESRHGGLALELGEQGLEQVDLDAAPVVFVPFVIGDGEEFSPVFGRHTPVGHDR